MKMTKKAIVYGAGQNFMQHHNRISSFYQIIGVIDASRAKTGTEILGFTIKSLEDGQLKNNDFDKIIVTPTNHDGIIDCLIEHGVAREKIFLLPEMYEEEYRVSRMRIAVLFHGGIGDFLIGKNWLYHVVNKYTLFDEQWDVYLREGAYDQGRRIFESCGFVERILCESRFSMNSENYDLQLECCIVPYVRFFSGDKLVRRNEGFFDYILALYAFGLKNYCFDFCRNPNFFKTVRGIMDRFPNRQYHNYCDIFGDLNITDNYAYTFQIIRDENEILRNNGLLDKTYITMNTGRHRDYKDASGTRAWSSQKWNELAVSIKERFPDTITVQVGEKMSEADDIDVDVHLNGRTDLDEVGILMRHAAVHIDYDGGLVHVRHILNGGPSIVLFGSTAVERHSYKENVGIRTDICPEACEWTTGGWLRDCPRGMCEPICMSSIEPQYVCGKVAEVLKRLPDNFKLGYADGEEVYV